MNVFISYSHEDQKFVSALAQALKAHQIKPWKYQEDMPSNRHIDDVVHGSIKEADIVFVVWSKDSRESAWVLREAAIADFLGKLVQICIDSDDPPHLYRKYNAVKLPSEAPDDDNSIEFQKLLRDLTGARTAAEGSYFKNEASGPLSELAIHKNMETLSKYIADKTNYITDKINTTHNQNKKTKEYIKYLTSATVISILLTSVIAWLYFEKTHKVEELSAIIDNETVKINEPMIIKIDGYPRNNGRTWYLSIREEKRDDEYIATRTDPALAHSI